jgi:hypothetical protein
MRHHRQLARAMMDIREGNVWRFSSTLGAIFLGHALQRLARRAGFSETARWRWSQRRLRPGRSRAAFSALYFSKGNNRRPNRHGLRCTEMIIPDRIVVTPASRQWRAALGDPMVRRPPKGSNRNVAPSEQWQRPPASCTCCELPRTVQRAAASKARAPTHSSFGASPTQLVIAVDHPSFKVLGSRSCPAMEKASRQLARNRPGQGQAGRRYGRGRWVGRQRPPRRASAHYSPVRARACATACSVA